MSKSTTTVKYKLQGLFWFQISFVQIFLSTDKQNMKSY